MTPGFHTITAEAYHADPCPEPSLSNSLVQILLGESPRKAAFSHPRLNKNYKPKESAEFDLGTAAHDLILEGGTPRICVIKPEDYRSKPDKNNPDGAIPKGWTNNAIRAAREEARAHGLTPILPWDHVLIKAMADAAKDFLATSELAVVFDDGKPEQTMIWQEGTVWCRARPDWHTTDRRLMLDYKSTTDASPDGFSRQIVRMGYHIQEAFYRRGCAALAGRSPAFVFLAQSIEPPHECTLHACDPALQEIADAEVERAIGIWRECMKKNDWPSYGGRIHWTVPATWQMRDHELRLQEAA